MHEFLSAHRADLIGRCQEKVAQRSAGRSTAGAAPNGVPLFLDQLIKTLQVEQTPSPLDSRRVSGPSGGGNFIHSEIGVGAARHGDDLFSRGFTVEQVVHDYGDLCQAITDLAYDIDLPFSVDEFRTLNRCLDNAIAGAVTAFNYRRDTFVAANDARSLNERLGSFAHELRNLLNTATLALQAIKEGEMGLGGATGTILERSLVGLRILVDRSLTEVRMAAGMRPLLRLFSLADFIAEVELSASLEAKTCECLFHRADVDSELAVAGDRDLLLGALGNLLQNAFKFTHHGSEVRLVAHAVADRIHIDVEDHCGGLPPEQRENLFTPFMQASANRSGLGLGLTISQSSVEANGGTLSVRDIPGSGCVFTINLPRHSWPAPPLPVAG